MLYLVSDASEPVAFLSAGNLINEDGYVHPKRVIDSYELISVTRGDLHIQSGERSYHLAPGQFIFLFSGECHFGTEPTRGEISFYWMHFYFQKKEEGTREALSREEALSQEEVLFREETLFRDEMLFQEEALFREGTEPHYILPETGAFSANSRVNVLFVQLLDLAKRLGSFSAIQCSYAQSTLLLELTNECFFRHRLMRQGEEIPSGVADLLEWLELNYDTGLSVAGIAEKFGYHPSYLTALFKRYSGCTITEYLNRQRIHVAKNLLTSAPKLSLPEIGEQVGIGDVKYFMRLFKRYEGITATAYREAFFRKRKNRI